MRGLTMRDDSRFDQYFSARAISIELPPAGIASVMDRAARRHRHRRAAVSACAAVAVLTGALSFANLDGAPSAERVDVRQAGPVLVDSSLVWHAVTPRAALSWSNSTVVGPGNALYSLSTAPGAVTEDSGPVPATLYRSADGIEWTPTALPDNLNPSSLATSDHLLYAIGTAPAGGNLRAVQLASTNTAGAAWSRVTLPINVAALEARYGVHVGLNRLTVASNGTRVVVGVRVQVEDDLAKLMPRGIDVSQGYSVTETGVDVYVASTPGAAPAEKEAAVARKMKAPVVSASYTWDQLNIDAALRSLLLGETRVFVSDDGSNFAETSLPRAVRQLGALLATADGFSLVGSSGATYSTIESWSSADGHTWQADAGLATPGYVLASGTRRDRGVVVIAGQPEAGEQVATIKVQQGDGKWSELGVTDLVRRAGIEGDFSTSGAAVGPLGVALVVTQYGSDEKEHSYLVTTTDGIEASVVDLAPLVGEGHAGDVRVTADAITVTVSGNSAGSPVQLLVGTPKR
ncbi:MAG: hypothetical protein ABI658_10490 [Acidimicrobiales bacterium]